MKITFDVTIGSHFPTEEEKAAIYNPHDWSFPMGGELKLIDVEFEPHSGDDFKDACDALKKQLGRDDYHIWYWSWHTT